MKSSVVSGLLVGTGLAFSAGEVEAASTIVFKGDRYYCQTSCQVAVSGGNAWVVDAAGGWVQGPSRRPIPTYPPGTCEAYGCPWR
jgi:hypothetical protein